MFHLAEQRCSFAREEEKQVGELTDSQGGPAAWDNCPRAEGGARTAGARAGGGPALFWADEAPAAPTTAVLSYMGGSAELMSTSGVSSGFIAAVVLLLALAAAIKRRLHSAESQAAATWAVKRRRDVYML